MLFPAIFINVIQLTTKSLYFWDSLQLVVLCYLFLFYTGGTQTEHRIEKELSL